MFRILILASALALFGSCSKETKEKVPPTVILVSFDGFRNDYIDIHKTPNLLKLKAEGSSFEGLRPCFPSKTFPNHYSIITGLLPGNHGLIANTFWSKEKQMLYSIGNQEVVTDGSWYQGTPLWNLSSEQGVKSASFFWVGSEANINNRYPDSYKKYDGSVSHRARLDTLRSWLKQKDPPRFISLYFSVVDNAGHNSGPLSDETGVAVSDLDQVVGELMAIQQQHPYASIVLVSDHGMSNLDPSMGINLPEEITKDTSGKIIAGNVFYLIYNDDTTKINSWKNTLKQKQSEGYAVYDPTNFPEHASILKGKNSPDLMVIANAPHWFHVSAYKQPTGTHGFDPYKNEEMLGILYAYGPAFKKGYFHDRPINNTHIYPLIAEILQLDYDKKSIDGQLDSIQFILN